MKSFLIKALASGFGFGYLRPFAGTWGTIPGTILCFLIFPLGPAYQFATLGILFVASIWISSLAEKIYGHDNKRIVIDEMLGITVTMMLVPIPWDWRYYLIGFVLFRIFDVAKIEPAKLAERLPSGWGVTMDDFVAGIYANITLRLLAKLVFKL